MTGSSGDKRIGPASFSAIMLPPLAIALLTIVQVLYSRHHLTALILRNGRIVLSSGEYVHDRADRDRNGSVHNLIDGNLLTAAILPFPGPPPEGTYLLIDSALSHWPPARLGEAPRPRRPASLRVYSGPCHPCSPDNFRRYSRIRRARIEILNRQANDPDRDFRHERTFPVRTMVVEFPDRSGPFDIALDLPPAQQSPGYPRNVFYIVCKITVLDIYRGEVFPGRVAVAEFLYGDRPGGALQDNDDIVYW